jgi:hypothetical protein
MKTNAGQIIGRSAAIGRLVAAQERDRRRERRIARQAGDVFLNGVDAPWTDPRTVPDGYAGRRFRREWTRALTSWHRQGNMTTD